jgi:hypothetical protein
MLSARTLLGTRDFRFMSIVSVTYFLSGIASCVEPHCDQMEEMMVMWFCVCMIHFIHALRFVMLNCLTVPPFLSHSFLFQLTSFESSCAM